MSEFKGTPGPWEVNVIGTHWNNRSLTHIEVTFGDDGECVCDTIYQPEDAKLIAAAPELLEALIGVVRVADRKTDEFDAARAAISKALGE